MRKYPDRLERTVRVKQQVDEWARSGLLTPGQQGQIAADLGLDVRRTNAFLRGTLAVFGVLIVAATVALVMLTLEFDEEESAGVVFLIAAALWAATAEFLVSRFRLYRFGIEEACAACAVVLAGSGTGLLLGDIGNPGPGDPRIVVALLVGAASAFGVFLRYGFVYAAFAALLAVALAPFELGLRPHVERLIAAAAVMVCGLLARRKRREHGNEFPGDDYGLVQAGALGGLYLLLNLKIGVGWLAGADVRWFYWLTFGAIWILPIVALRAGLRERDRPLLDVGIAMALATLMTNKPYLGLEQRAWDLMLFGLLLIVAAVAVRRWLSGGPDGMRSGFTARQILRREKELLAQVATASTAFQPGITPRAPQPRLDSPFDGGRSGGGGAGASY